MFGGGRGRGFGFGGNGPGGWRVPGPQGFGQGFGQPFGQPFGVGPGSFGGWGMGPVGPGGPRFRGGPPRGGGGRGKKEAKPGDQSKKQPEVAKTEVAQSSVSSTPSTSSPSKLAKPGDAAKNQSGGGGALIKCAPCSIDIIGSEVRLSHTGLCLKLALLRKLFDFDRF